MTTALGCIIVSYYLIMTLFETISMILALLFSGITVAFALQRLSLGLSVLPMLSLNTFSVLISGLKFASGELAAGFLAGLWIIQGGVRRIGAIRIPLFIYTALGYIALVAISVVNASNSFVVGRETIQYFLYFIIIPLMVLTTLSKKEAIQAVHYFAKIGVIVATITVLMWIVTGKPAVLVDHLLHQNPLGISYRETGIFGHYNVFGAALTLVIPLVLSFLLQEKRLNKKVVFGMYLILLALGIIASFSRGAMLGVLIAGTFLVYVYPPSTTRTLYSGGIIGGFVLLITSIIISVPIPRYALEKVFFSAITGGEGRFVLWEASLGMMKDYPLVGVGAGNFALRIQDYVSYQQDTAHNLYLNIAAETGLPSLIVFFAVVYFMVRPLWKYIQIKRKTRKVDVSFAVVAGVFSTIIAFLIDNVATPLFVTGVAIPFITLVTYAHVIVARGEE